jgi:RNA polymerase sigma-70 factor (ECF subfamily)
MDGAAPDIDLRLIERFAGGDRAAFDALVARHRRAVHNFVYHMVGDREAAEEVTVDVFLQVYSSLSSFKGNARFSTWLHRIAINVCLQHLRRPRLRWQAAEVPLEEHVLVSEDALEPVLRGETIALVVAAMQQLPQTQRAAVIAYYLQDRDLSEIAEILKVPVGTAKTRVFHGTKALREKLRALGVVPSSRRGGK